MAGATAAAQPAQLDLFDDLLGAELLPATGQRLEAAAGQVLVEIERVQIPVMLGGNVFLPAEERRDRWVAQLDRAAPAFPR